MLKSAIIPDANVAVASHCYYPKSMHFLQVMLLSKEYTFQNVNKTFTSKTSMSCNSFIGIYLVICSGCWEELEKQM